MKKIAIIGAGLGGLSAAIRLSSNGFDVSVFEKNSYPGGKASQIINSGFRFDAGPSLLTMPYVLNDLFEQSGERMEEHLDIKKLEIICKYFYNDGTIINAYSDLQKFGNELERNTLDNSTSLKKYFNYCANIYDLTADLFLFKSPAQLSTFFSVKAFKTLLQLNKIDPFRTMHRAVSTFFKDKKTIQLFDRYATYNGSNPYQTPATLNIIPHVEYNLGSFIPAKGIYSITESLYKLALKKGVKFYFNSQVDEIIYAGKNANGIKVNNQLQKFDLIISNADVNQTFNKLLPSLKSKEKIKNNRLNPSTSGLVFYWGIDGKFNNLETHNILFSEDYKKEFDDIFVNKTIPADPTVYIYISSKLNKDDAPPEKENWFVMINTPHIENQNWQVEIKLARERIIKKVNQFLNVDIESKIICEQKLTPHDIQERTGSMHGSIYGISSNDKRAAFMRQQNKSKSLNNLYFCGGSVHPGGGIPLVILSGKIVTDLIMKDFNI